MFCLFVCLCFLGKCLFCWGAHWWCFAGVPGALLQCYQPYNGNYIGDKCDVRLFVKQEKKVFCIMSKCRYGSWKYGCIWLHITFDLGNAEWFNVRNVLVARSLAAALVLIANFVTPDVTKRTVALCLCPNNQTLWRSRNCFDKNDASSVLFSSFQCS